MTNILAKKIMNELNDVYGITGIGIMKKNIYVYVLNDYYKIFAQTLLKQNFNDHELEQVKIVVTGHEVIAVD